MKLKRHGHPIASDDAAQLERFKEAARELGCDDDAGRFEAKLGKIAKAKPAPAKPSPKRNAR